MPATNGSDSFKFGLQGRSGNLDDRDKVIGEAMEKLCDRIAVVHLKDCAPDGDDLKSIAAGTGVMDYREILKFIKARKPYIHTTLENTVDENAVRSRVFLQELYDSI